MQQDLGHIQALQERLHSVQERVILACQKAGRSLEDVTLLAVSKMKPIEDIEAIYNMGHIVFGENYVQEWMGKADSAQLQALPELKWHFIGHLQSNKCKFVAGRTQLIHSVHSLSVLRELEKRTPEGVKQPVLLQFNVGEESSKSGFTHPEEVLPLLQPEKTWERVEIQGLMALPPYCAEAEETRPFFRQVRMWRDQLQDETGVQLPHLSMGMSHDLDVAIQEGATFVRVGTAIFGSRTHPA